MQQIKINHGFTLIELMVTIAVMAIIATIAAPSFGDMITRQKLNALTRDLMMAINQAKSQAALLRTTVAVCPSKTNLDDDFTKVKCATTFIVEYTAPNPSLSPSEIQILKQNILAERVYLVDIDPKVAVQSTSTIGALFNATGNVNSQATFSFCKSGLQKTVSVTRLGIMSQTSGTC